MTKKLKEFYYSLTGIQFHPLILWKSFTRSIKQNKDQSVTHNIFRIQGNDFIMCWFYYDAFIEFMLVEKT